MGEQFAQAHTTKEMSRMTFKPTLVCTHASPSHHPTAELSNDQYGSVTAQTEDWERSLWTQGAEQPSNRRGWEHIEGKD